MKHRQALFLFIIFNSLIYYLDVITEQTDMLIGYQNIQFERK